jgi:hypothetical protein
MSGLLRALPSRSTWRLLYAMYAPYFQELAAAEDCRRVMTVDGAISNARRLNGKIVCVRGVVEPSVYSWRTAALVFKMHNGRDADGWRKRREIGVIDWAPETGVDAALYKPDSFKLFDRIPNSPESGKPLAVVFRGAIMCRKGFLRQLAARLPTGELYDPVRGLSFPVELVVVEVVSANAIH